MRSFVARLDPRRAPVVVLLLAPPVLLVLIIGLTPEPARLILAGDLSLYHRYGLQLLGDRSRTSTSTRSTRRSPSFR